MRTGTVLVLTQNAFVLETSARLLRLLGLFQSRTLWTAPELAVRLDVTERTVRRDVARLRDLGYPVEARPGVDGGYRLGSGTTVPPLLLDDDEVVAVAVGLSAAADGSVGGLDEAAVRALAKLERVLPARLQPRLASVRAATVALGPGGPAVDPEALTALATACDLHERVRFARAYRWQLRALVEAPADAVAAVVPSTVAVVEAVDEQRCLFVSGSDSLESLAVHLGRLGAQLGVAVRVLEPPELRPVLRTLSASLAAAADRD